MRANRQGFLAGEYSHIGWNETGGSGTQAAEDLKVWQTTIDAVLPGDPQITAGTIQHQAESNVVTVIVRWGTASSGTPSTLTLRSEI
jgi:hypothetical protein